MNSVCLSQSLFSDFMIHIIILHQEIKLAAVLDYSGNTASE